MTSIPTPDRPMRRKLLEVAAWFVPGACVLVLAALDPGELPQWYLCLVGAFMCAMAAVVFFSARFRVYLQSQLCNSQLRRTRPRSPDRHDLFELNLDRILEQCERRLANDGVAPVTFDRPLERARFLTVEDVHFVLVPVTVGPHPAAPSHEVPRYCVAFFIDRTWDATGLLLEGPDDQLTRELREIAAPE